MVKNKFYNEDLYDSLQQPNFFNDTELKFVTDGYWKLYDEVLNKIEEFDQDTSYMRIEEANFSRKGTSNVLWSQIVCAIRDKESHNRKKRIQLDFNQGNEEFEFIQKYNDWLKEIIRMMEIKFEEIGRPAKVVDIAFHNFSSSLKIHCDGQDILQKLKNTSPRPRHHPKYLKQEWDPVEYFKYAHQGLINLDAQPDKATVIFDQWFPFSTYYDIVNTTKSLDEMKRPCITWCKDDKGVFERFGEHVRGLTGKPFSNLDYIQMMKPIANPNAIKLFKENFPKEKLHGLSLNKILYFGHPGTLISWDNKRYHMAKPFRLQGTDGIGKENRLMLQFETLCI